MLKKQFIGLLFLIFFIPITFLLILSIRKSDQEIVQVNHQLIRSADRSKIKLLLGDKPLEVEVVNSQTSITQGLSSRDAIGCDGMLFVFSEKKIQNFWMKNMKFDLDFVWFADDKVVQLDENIAAPLNNDGQISTIQSNQAIDMVLELNAGQIKARHIKIGDVLSFE